MFERWSRRETVEGWGKFSFTAVLILVFNILYFFYSRSYCWNTSRGRSLCVTAVQRDASKPWQSLHGLLVPRRRRNSIVQVIIINIYYFYYNIIYSSTSLEKFQTYRVNRPLPKYSFLFGPYLKLFLRPFVHYPELDPVWLLAGSFDMFLRMWLLIDSVSNFLTEEEIIEVVRWSAGGEFETFLEYDRLWFCTGVLLIFFSDFAVMIRCDL